MAVDPKALAARLALKRGVLYRWLHILLPGAMLAAAVFLRVGDSDLVEAIQNQAFDLYQRQGPRPYQAMPVKILDIDEESLKIIGQWPWPRTKLAELLRKLDAMGASVVVFDALFPEQDRTSPGKVIESWPQDDPAVRELKPRVAKLTDHDTLFARAMSKTRVVLGFALRNEASDTLPERKAGIALSGEFPTLPKYKGAVGNLPVLEKAASGIGNVGFSPSSDGIIRAVPLVFNVQDKLYPGLAAEALRVAQGAKTIAIKTSGGSGETNLGERTGIVKVKIGQFVIPTDGQGRVWLHYTKLDDDKKRFIPVWKIFKNEVPREEIENGILFLGTSAQGLRDIRATPINGSAAGVEVHAQVVEQALLGHWLNRPDWALGAEVLFLVALGLMMIFMMNRIGPAYCAALGACVIAGSILASWRSFTYKGWLFDAVYPSLMAILIYLAASLISYLKAETEKRQIRGAFSRYMHPKLVEELARHPEKLRLGGETRPMTILFCDIRGFTTISEQYDAAGLTHVINKFLTPMTGEIMERLGYIDKYIGDCIMAFWNAPLDDAQHANNACASALAMIAKLKDVNAALRAEADAAGKKFYEINIGVGLNTGDCCVGNMGSDQRFNYSVLGDDVNLASRLEGQSKSYGVNIIIGPTTRELAPDYAAIELDLIKVKGKTRPVRIYSLIGDRTIAADPKFKELVAEHEKMLEAYRAQDWDQASKHLAATVPLAEGWKLSKLHHVYESRIEAYRTAPPGADWDGAFTATSK
ncbi:MAG: adenylate/guanylate cyclase domain-containing protein [Elusimicrobia bacterium]|nr:adenylate/guanylate cyclase domain-containing protein [Elusimicrobiota bacterium]